MENSKKSIIQEITNFFRSWHLSPRSSREKWWIKDPNIGVEEFYILEALEESKSPIYRLKNFIKTFWEFSPTVFIVVLIAILEIYLLVLPEFGIYDRYEWVTQLLKRHR